MTAVHTDEEIQLYNKFLSDSQLRGEIRYNEEDTKPNFDLFAKKWSSYCEPGKKIYFKTPKHLEAYFNILADRKKYGDSVLHNIDLVREVRSRTQAESRFTQSIPALPQPTPPTPQPPAEASFTAFQPVQPIQPIQPIQPTQPIVQLRFLRPAIALALLQPVQGSSLLGHSSIINGGIRLVEAPQITKKKKKQPDCLLCERTPGCKGGINRQYCTNKCGNCEQPQCIDRWGGPKCPNPKKKPLKNPSTSKKHAS